MFLVLEINPDFLVRGGFQLAESGSAEIKRVEMIGYMGCCVLSGKNIWPSLSRARSGGPARHADGAAP